MTVSTGSLYEITTELLALHQRREEAEFEGDSAEVEKIDGLIKVYLEDNLPTKVDSVRGYIKWQENAEAVHKAEAELHAALAKQARGNIDRMKGLVLYCLNALGKTKLEGSLHWLRKQANGGLRAVEIKQPELVPPGLCRVTITMPGDAYQWLCKVLDDRTFDGGPMHPLVPLGMKDAKLEPDKARIGTALERGFGVPGCVLADRGEHIRTS